MALSKECQEYHLTSNGWVEGSFRGDVLGGRRDVAIPPDRVLTIGCFDELPSAFSAPFFYDKVLWRSEDAKAVKLLQRRYGRRPNDFRVAK
jgi:hypothetical protein